MFIGLNPSTADENNDDPTIRRCINYARDWGYGALCMVNLFAFRSTDPKQLWTVTDPIGPENIYWIETHAKQADVIVAAWGTKGAYRSQDLKVRRIIEELHCLDLSKDGFPKHPLYLKKNLKPQRWK